MSKQASYTKTFSSQTLLNFNVRYLGLLPEGKYNRDTLSLYAGVVDQTKVDSVSGLAF